MADLRHDGLIEAFLDFGVDLRSEGFDLPTQIVAGIQVQDLALNYKPALRAVSMTHFTAAANPATFGGAALQAGPTGFWLRTVCNMSANVLGISFSNNPATAANFTWAIPLGFITVGDSPGELRSGGIEPDFLQATVAGNTNPAGFANHFAFSATGNREGLFPIWVPPMMTLVIEGATNTQAVDFSLCLQFPAQCPGRLP